MRPNLAKQYVDADPQLKLASGIRCKPVNQGALTSIPELQCAEVASQRSQVTCFKLLTIRQAA